MTQSRANRTTEHLPAATAQPPPGQADSLFRRVLLVTVVFIVTMAFFAVLWYAQEVVLLAFAGVLLAVFLSGLADLLGRYTGLSRGWSLGVVAAALVVVIGGGGALFAPSVAAQTDELIKELPVAAGRLEESLRRYEWGRQLLANMPSGSGWVARNGGLSGKVFGVFSTALDVLVGVVVFFCVGLFLAMEPGVYTEGVVRLVPLAGRHRAREVLGELGHTLRWWLMGRAVAMLFVGALTALGLWLLGIPFALPLALLTTLLGLVPYFGPVVAVVPAALLGFIDGPWKAAAVAALYLVVQVTEGNILTPLVQRRAVEIPPALTLIALLLIGTLFGPLGMALAVPLTAVGLVLVKRLYVEDVLGDGAGADSGVTPQVPTAQRDGVDPARSA